MEEDSDGSMQQPNHRSVQDTAPFLEAANILPCSKLPPYLASSKLKNDPPQSNGSFLTSSMSEQSQGSSVLLTIEQTLPPKVSPRPKPRSSSVLTVSTSEQNQGPSALLNNELKSQTLPPKVSPRPKPRSSSVLTVSTSEQNQGPSVLLNNELKSQTLPPKVSPRPKPRSSSVLTVSTSEQNQGPSVLLNNELKSQTLPPKVSPRPKPRSSSVLTVSTSEQNQGPSVLLNNELKSQTLPPKVSPRPKPRSSSVLTVSTSEQNQGPSVLLNNELKSQTLPPKVSPRPKPRSSSVLTVSTSEQNQGPSVLLNNEQNLQTPLPIVPPRPKPHQSSTSEQSQEPSVLLKNEETSQTPLPIVPPRPKPHQSSTSEQNQEPSDLLKNEETSQTPLPIVPPKVALRQKNLPKIAPRPKSSPLSIFDVEESRKLKKRPVPKLFGRLNPSTLMSKLKNRVLGEAHEQQPILEGDEDDAKLFEEDFATNFETTSEALAKRLLQFSDCIAEGLSVSREVLQQILLQLRKKRIFISVLGRHNTGKSTFLNALLANELLPMDARNETSVKVKIKHEKSVHRFPCSKQGNNPKATCKACPYILEEQGSNYCKWYQGAHNITTALKKVNSTVRVSGKKVALDYEVHGYVSCISEAVTPPNWSVLLMDNPGFGEGNQEEITREAETSLTTSSAYVHIMAYTHLDDEKDVAALKHIYCKDKDVFKKNRLLVVVTYFDDYYKALLESYDEDEEIILKSDDVKKKVKDVVQRATEGACDIPDENVVPICGQWALYSKQLHHQPENTKLQHYVEKFLSMYEGPTTKGPDIATELEEASGIRMAEERIKEMAQSSFESWVESTKNTFDGFLIQACQKFDGAAQSQEEFANCEEEDYNLHKEQLVDLDKKRKECTDSLSEVYRELSKVYPRDTEKPIEEGKRTVQDRVDSLKKACVAKCAGDYQPQEFRKDVDDILEEALCSVRSTLDTTCSFSSMQTSLQDQMVLQPERFTALKAAATAFLGESMVSASTGEEETGSSEETIESIMQRNPATLEELRKKVQIPSLSKRWLRKITAIWDSLRRKEQGSGLRPHELEKPLNALRQHLENECSRYFDENKAQIVKYFYGVFERRANKFLEAFDRKFMRRIQSRKQQMTEEKVKIDGYREEVQTLRVWSVHLEKVGRHLFRKADECLQQLSTKGARTHEPTKQLPNSNETPGAVKEERRAPKPTRGVSQSNEIACATNEDANTVETTSVKTSFQAKREGETKTNEVPTIQMGALPEPVTVRVAGQSIEIPVDKHTSIWGVVEKTLQAHDYIPDEYSIYNDDGEVDKDTKSSEYAGYNLFLQHKTTSAGVFEEHHGFKPHRSRSDAIVIPNHGKRRRHSAFEYSDAPKSHYHQFPTYGGRPCFVEEPHITNLFRSINASRKGAKEEPKGDGAVRRLLKRIVSRSSRTERTLPGTPESFESDFKEDLMATCEVVKTRLEELQTECDLLNVVSAELIHGWKRAEERYIRIAVFGNCNSGKSLLLNALLWQRMLPVSRAKQTMVKVKLQHDRSLHDPKLSPGHPESEPCEKCIKLMKGSSEQSRGIKNTSEALSRTNKSVQSLQSDTLQEDDDYIIHANIPLLVYINVPEPWQVHLVDNPGFMELTEVEMERQLKKEVMALSAYIYTVSYNELQDALSSAAFKLISDQDQAKAARLENRLLVVVTHFDRYYNASSKEGMLNEEQVKDVVCTSIKNTTGRTFPRESVIPICSHWAIIARQLIRQLEDERYVQRALNCFHHCLDERIQNLLTGDESSFTIGNLLENESGIKHLETRIVQMSRQACADSIYTMTRSFSVYLGAAVKNLCSLMGRTNELIEDHVYKLRSEIAYKERITNNKKVMARFMSGTESAIHQDLQSYCEDDIQGLLNSFQSKSRELQQLFKQDCAAKISADVAFGPPEFEEGLGQLLQGVCEQMQILWNDMEFESTRRCFDQKIKEANEKYEQIRQDACKFCMREVLGHKEDVCVDIDAFLNALKKMPPTLSLQELKTQVNIPRTGGVLHKQKKYTRLGQLQTSFDQLKEFMDGNLSSYLDSMTPRLMELLYGQFCDHVKKQEKAFDEEFSSLIQTREMEMNEIVKVKETLEDEVRRMDRWSKHLEKLQKHLEKKSKEILKHSE